MKMKKILASVVAFLLVAMLPVVAFGASHDVSDWDGFKGVFSTDTDENVIINLLNDILGEGAVTTGENQNYTINGGAFKVADVTYDGKGNVTVNAQSENLTVQGDVVLEQNGDVEGGLTASGNADVTVNGDINSEDKGVKATGKASVDVIGDITAGNDAVNAGGDTNVQVTGNLQAGEDGVEATGNANVTVNGNIDAGYGVYTPEDDNTGENNATVTVNGDIDAEHTGLLVSGESKVTVNGNVTGADQTEKHQAGDGVFAYGNAEVTVNGNVSGGNATMEVPPPGSTPGPLPIAGEGVAMENTAKVTVNGNVSGGNNSAKEGNAGHGVRIWVLALEEGQTTGSLTVNGSVNGGVNTGAEGKDGNSIYYDVILAVPEITGTTYAEISGELQQGFVNLMNAASVTGILTPEKMNAITGVDGVLTKAGNQITAIINGAQLETLSAAQISAIKDVYTQVLNDVYAIFFPTGFVYDIPEITVGKLQAVNDAFFGAGAENMQVGYGLMSSVQTTSPMNSQALADLLGAQVNYFVNVPQVVGGKVTADKATAKAGETVTFTVTPAEGYVLDSFMVNGKTLSKNADGTYSYVMETGGAEIAVAFAKVGETEDTTTKGGVPKTGDNNMLFALLAVLCLAGIATVLKKRGITGK